MRIAKLTHIGYYLNGAQGSRKYDDISIAEVKGKIHDTTLFTWLSSRLGHDFDVSILSTADRAELLAEWADYADSIDEARKLCVDKGGLCLLVSYILQSIQSRQDSNPPVGSARDTAIA